jgi:hypothetical protein
MLNALVLYRFTDPRSDPTQVTESKAAKLVREVVVPAMTRHFRVITIKAVSNVPGTLDYWLHVFEKAEYLVDIIMAVELASDRLSENVIYEQINSLAQSSGQSMKQVMLANCLRAYADAPKVATTAEAVGSSPKEVTEFGRMYFLKLTDMPSLLRRSITVSSYDASFAFSSRDLDPVLLSRLDGFLGRVRAICEAREANFRTKFPAAFGLHMRMRQLFEDDAFFQRNLQFHNNQNDPTGRTPDARDDKWRRFVKLMIYGNEEGVVSSSTYQTMPVKPMLVHNTFKKGSFLGFCTSIIAALSSMLGLLANRLRSVLGLPPKTVQLPKAIHMVLMVCALLVALLTWPFYYFLVRARRARGNA